jgi:hypothetical protein
MKKNLLTLLLSTFTSLIFSQVLVDIPLKNGMAYYTFYHKLTNKNKCLSTYFINSVQIQEKVETQTKKIQTESKQIGNLQKIDLFGNLQKIQLYKINVTNNKLKKINCTDTISFKGNNKNSNFYISIEEDKKLKFKPSLINYGRKKIYSHTLTASISIIFKSKNEYTLVIKDIEYSVHWALNGKEEKGIDIYKLGEFYELAQKTENLKKDDILLFNDIDKLIKTADDIILKAITDTYNVDEL